MTIRVVSSNRYGVQTPAGSVRVQFCAPPPLDSVTVYPVQFVPPPIVTPLEPELIAVTMAALEDGALFDA